VDNQEAKPEEKLFLRQSQDLSPSQRRALKLLKDRNPELVNRLVEKSVRDGQPQVNLQDPDLRRLITDEEKRQKDRDHKNFPLTSQERQQRQDLQELKKQVENPSQPTRTVQDPPGPNPQPDGQPPAPPTTDKSGPTPDQNPSINRSQPDSDKPNAAEQESQTGIRRKLLEVMDKLDDPDGPLGKSRAWHEMLDDVSQHLIDGIGSGAGGDGKDLEGQVTFLGRYVHEVDRWSEPGRAAVQRLHLDAALREQVPRAGSTRGWAPSGSVPRVGGSSLPGMEAVMAMLWAGMIGVAVALLWQVLRRRKGAAQRAVALRPLGPWPVPPQQVTTREQVIRAFEYLSLLCLGPAARSQNHLEIAAALGGDEGERRRAAAELAAVYEQARYAPADEALADEAVAAARRDLCFLAGVAAA
jgi:hypothetical protein